MRVEEVVIAPWWGCIQLTEGVAIAPQRGWKAYSSVSLASTCACPSSVRSEGLMPHHSNYQPQHVNSPAEGAMKAIIAARRVMRDAREAL